MTDKNESLRFGIRNGSGDRAATLKLWTKRGTGKSDVYLTCRELHDTIKVSLHESEDGKLHIRRTRSNKMLKALSQHLKIDTLRSGLDLLISRLDTHWLLES